MMKKMLSIFVFACMVISGLIGAVSLFSTTISAPDPLELPDLTISQQNITISPATPIAGEPTTINATIWNVGNADATNVEVNFYEGDTLIGSKNVDFPVNRTWATNTLDSTGIVGGDSSIVVDDEKGVHISYTDSTNRDLKYTYKPNGGNWTIYSIDTIGDVGRYTSIGIDSAKGVHISYYDATNYDLKYAYKSNLGSWDIQTIDPIDTVGFGNSLVVDDSDGIHISYGYSNGTNCDLKYAYKPSGGSWINQTVDSNGNVGIRTSIALDNSGGVHISYYNTTIQTETKLKYAYKPNGGSWSFYTVDNIGENCNLDTSIDIDDVNGVHISYYEDTNGDLKYAYKPSGGSWTTYYVDSSGSVGSWNSLAIDDVNGIHISYRDQSSKDLKYAYKPSGGNWTTHYADSPGDVGMDTSIAVDDSNGIHISYLDREEGDLKYANLIDPSRNIQVSIPWTPPTPGLKNITVRLDENNVIQELDETNNDATIEIIVNSSDNDLDEMPDWWEKIHGFDPLDPSDSSLDPDLDGLTNLQEFLNYSNPNKNDTDGDNLGDGFEVIFSKTNASLWDTNGNGIGDGLEFIRNKGYLGWIESLPDDWIGMIISWENYTIYVKTNSSVLEGEFDKEEQKLKIKVSGPNGTLGVTEIDVPKSLCEPEDIEIKLDGELINYTVTEDDTYYYIHIEYTHSIHELTADFNHISEGPSESTDKEEGVLTNIYLISLIIALIIILQLSIVVIRNRRKSEDIGVQELPPEKLSILLDKKHAEGKITDETYNDAKSLLEKYRSD